MRTGFHIGRDQAPGGVDGTTKEMLTLHHAGADLDDDWVLTDLGLSPGIYLPPTNEVCEGYVFTGVCLSTGGCLPLVPGGVSATHPLGRHPLGRHPPCADTPQADTPTDKHPPRQTPPAVLPGIWSTSKQYPSHWNAFVFMQLLPKLLFVYLPLQQNGTLNQLGFFLFWSSALDF